MQEETPPKCLDKLAFNSQKEAWTAATVARFQHGDVRLKTYRCKDCGLWHLASSYTDK
ncbi:MAG: hypothetical protein WCJ60_04375 [bacterium]